MKRFCFFHFLFCLFLVLCPACSKFRYADARPLEEAGMNYATVKQLRELSVTDAEVAELAHARRAPFSDAGCLELLRIARSRQKPLTEGEEAAQLVRAGMKEETVLELARLDQLGPWTGEAELMRMAGLSDSLILVLARRRAESLETLSGASLARLRNAGISDRALIELARRGVADADTETILALRRRGVREAEILRRFTGSKEVRR